MKATRTTRASAALAAALLSTFGAVVLLSPPSSAAAAGDPGAVSISKTLTRAHLDADGGEDVVDKRDITVKVSRTKDLRSRQPIEVSWKGAHPTGGIVSDSNSSQARLQEYPFLLLECRGVDSTTVPAAQQISQQTCWTQSSPERFSRDVSSGFPAWRVDRRAPGAERQAVVGAPSPRPAECGKPSPAERFVPFVSVKGDVYSSDGGVCGQQAPEAADTSASGQPGNTTYGITQQDGTGTTKFTTWTEEDNASLGCSTTVPCSLVVVPIMGISCDETAASLPEADRPGPQVRDSVMSSCRSNGRYAPGSPNQNGSGNADAVSGSMWWSASNWAGRITVPLSFAPLASVCDVTGGRSGVEIYGSELLVQATSQWRPTFCLDTKRTPFKHVQVGEPQARSLVQNGTAEAAFTSDPPEGGWSKPVVNAPTALTGFAVSYTVDGVDQQPVTDLKLNARLLAKLLTESYPASNPVQDEYAALRTNPLNMSQDPEFQALNPTARQASESAATLFSLSSDSDVIRSLTTYVDQDPEARAFLDGKADPFGMVVNPNYRGIDLPVDNLPQLDDFQPKKYYASGVNRCLQNDPVPFLPLVAAPTSRLAAISLALQFSLSPSQIACQETTNEDGVGNRLVALGRQQPGFRFLLGITSLGDARRYDLDTAALQTTTTAAAPTSASPTASASTSATASPSASSSSAAAPVPTSASPSPAATPFTSGRAFVAPTDAGLAAAAKLLRPDAASGTWRRAGDSPVDATATSSVTTSSVARAAALRVTAASASASASASAGPSVSASASASASPTDAAPTAAQVAAAYPGTMVVYTAVPTKGLPAKDAKAYADFLRFVAGVGQTSGTSVGQLPPGFLPLTGANGLQALSGYTARAATAVAAQKGDVPPLVVVPAAAASASPSASASNAAAPAPDTSFPVGSGTGTSGGTAPVLPGVPTSVAGAPKPTVAPTRSTAAVPQSLGVTPAASSSLAGSLLPLLVLGGLLGLGATFALRASGRKAAT